MPDAVTVTFFTDFAATTKREETIPLGGLTQRILETSAPAKRDLPWLKFARFGSARTTKRSLRHDRNVITITGVEGDYDAERLSLDEAVEIAEKAGLRAIVYTSPSHTPQRPRWRILAPTSRELSPGDRSRLLNRLNGLYRGVFAAESWTLSQSYYFGSINRNPAHRVEVVEGQPIDLLDELDRIAIGKPNGTAPPHDGEPRATSGSLDEDALIEAIISGKSYHTSCTRLVGKWAQQGVPFLDAQKRLLELFDSAFPLDCGFRRCRPGIPIDVGHLFRSMSAGRSD